MKLDITEEQLDLMLGSYMRYSLGRMTYIVDACCDTLELYVPRLPLTKQFWYAEQIRRALINATNNETTLGMQMDHDRWQRCLERLSGGLSGT